MATDVMQEVVNIGSLALEPLIERLKNKDRQYYGVSYNTTQISAEDQSYLWRSAAVQALGKIRDVGAVEPLIGALNEMDNHSEFTPKVSFRAAIARALGRIGDRKAIEPLSKAIREDVSFKVRRIAAEGLLAMGIEPDLSSDKINYLIYENKWDELVALGEIAVEPIAHVFTSGERDQDVNLRDAALALARIGTNNAVSHLISALSCFQTSHNPEEWHPERYYSMKRALELTKKQERFSQYKEATLAAWKKLGKSALKTLIDVLLFSQDSVREGAVIALGEIGDKQAIEPLMRVMEDAKVITDTTTRNDVVKRIPQAIERIRQINQKANASLFEQKYVL